MSGNLRALGELTPQLGERVYYTLYSGCVRVSQRPPAEWGKSSAKNHGEIDIIRRGHQFLFQAAGRLLRSENDRGVITIVGRRFLDPRYVSLLPEEWTLGDPTNLIHDDPETAVREFFENDPESF